MSTTPGQRPAATVTLHCAYCNAGTLVPGGATFFNCRSCNYQNSIFTCVHCHSVSISAAPAVASPTTWTCQVCGKLTQIPRFGRMPVSTAAAAATVQAAQPVVTASTTTALSGFVALSSTHRAIPDGAPVTVTVLADGLDVRTTDQQSGHKFLYTDLTRFDVGGRTSPRRGRDGGLGLRRGAGQGSESILRLTAGEDSVVLNHPAHTRQHLAMVFGDALARWGDAKPPAEVAPSWTFDEAIAEFERLIIARERRQIADVDFFTQRTAIVRRLAARGPDRRSQPHQY